MTPDQEAACLSDTLEILRSLPFDPTVKARIYREPDWTDPDTSEIVEGGWIVEVRQRHVFGATALFLDCDAWLPEDPTPGARFARVAWRDLVTVEATAAFSMGAVVGPRIDSEELS